VVYISLNHALMLFICLARNIVLTLRQAVSESSSFEFMHPSSAGCCDGASFRTSAVLYDE
jgi:hypothetical protein